MNEGERLKKLMDEDLEAYRLHRLAAVHAEDKWSRVDAEEYIKVNEDNPDGTINFIKAHIVIKTADLKLEKELAEALWKIADKAWLTHQAQLLLYQSELKRQAAELGMARSG